MDKMIYQLIEETVSSYLHPFQEDYKDQAFDFSIDSYFNGMMPGSKGHCATGGCAWYTKFGLISACFGWYWRLHLAPFLCMLTFQNQKRPFDPGIMVLK